MKATLSEIEPRIVVKTYNYTGIDSYDTDNNYPQRVKDIADNSGMGTSCIGLYKSFLYGKGFQNTDFAKAIINRHKLTPDKLLNICLEDMAYYEGFALHVNYNALFEVSEVNYQPLDQVRFTNKDSKEFGKYAIYRDWGCRNIDDKWVNYIDKYNPDPNIISNQVDKAGGFNSYKGQIFYVSNRLLKYPKASYDAVLEDMQTDSQSKTYKYRNVKTGFLASHMIITNKSEDTGPDENEDRGYSKRRNRESNQFDDTIKSFQGADNAGKIIRIEKETPDQLFDIQKIEQQNGDRQFEFTEGSTRDNIRQAFLIPSILLMQQPGRLGTTTEFIDGTNYYNSVTEPKRLVVEQVFREVFSNFKETINADDNYFIAPKSPMKKNDPTNNTQIMNVLKDVSMSPEQKRDILVVLHEMPQEDADKLTSSLAVKDDPGGVERDPTQLFNGIQTTSMIAVVDAVKTGKLEPDEAKAILRISFRLNEEELNQVIGNGTNNNQRTDSGV